MTTTHAEPQPTTADRLVDATVDLIAERGGSQDVNLREIARRVGCAHTNVYNYFTSFDDLLWAAFRRTLRRYAERIVDGLDDSMTQLEYFRRLVTNLATFPQENPGLYRFIGSDPIDVDAIPEDILATVSRVKDWLFEAFVAVSGSRIGPHEAQDFCNITYGYIDGETFNYINGRVVPGEDIPGRIVKNSVRLFTVLTRAESGQAEKTPRDGYPELQLEDTAPG